jgi:drug/metabolite transporter (DMT)-like permease
MSDPFHARSPGAPAARTLVLTVAALVSFAANSLLCRAALQGGLIDATSFTLARLASGAVVLALLTRGVATASAASPVPSLRDRALSALALFSYALPFSLAYLRISAGTGAFVAFGCVQMTMIGSDLMAGRRLRGREAVGLGVALFGLGWLTRPGAASPDSLGVLLMALAGFSWGIYSIRGRRSGPPLLSTARNFAASVPLALVASLVALPTAHIGARGLLLALVSGGVTSGLGYVAWYAALPALSATRAAIVQLAVPLLASALGIVFLGETVNARLSVAAPLILGGIAIAVTRPLGRAVSSTNTAVVRETESG